LSGLAIGVICTFAAVAAWVIARILVSTSTRIVRTLDDVPGDFHKLHVHPTPRVGGMAVAIAVLGGSLAHWAVRDQMITLLLLLLCVMPGFLGGLAEDLFKRNAVLAPLAFTGVSASLAFVLLDARVAAIDAPIVDDVLSVSAISFAFTVFVVVGVTHSMNVIDGLNGLSSVTALLASIALGMVAWAVGDSFLFSVACLLAASLLGFLLVNFPSGRIFLGDGGAYLVGLLLTVGSVLLVQRNSEVSPWFPVVLLAYPICETLFSMYRRRIRGQSPADADALHLHTLVYRRVVRWKGFLATPSDSINRNSMASALLWVLPTLSGIMAVLFWDRSVALQIIAIAFATLYVALYRTIVHFGVPARFIIRVKALDAGKVTCRVCIVSRCSWTFHNFRLGLATALARIPGVSVTGAGIPVSNYAERIDAEGIEFVNLRGHLHRQNVISIFLFTLDLFRLYQRVRPQVVHHFTIKPVIFGTIAARLAGVPKIINTITGLGRAFEERRSLTGFCAKVLYRFSLPLSDHVFFQNDEDRELFTHSGLVDSEKTSVVPGSGVDVEKFHPNGGRTEGENGIVLMMSRLLRTKGVCEFVEAARILKSSFPDKEFVLLGGSDFENPAAISERTLTDWVRAGLISWKRHKDEIRSILEQADIVVLPSYYREGVPRSLLEAAAMGKAIVTTDNTGCREAVESGKNGLLVPPRDAIALADAIGTLLRDPALRESMGSAGRRKMLDRFDERSVINSAVKAYGLPCPITLNEAQHGICAHDATPMAERVIANQAPKQATA
jgi:UDP-N-acetylmuramyl pentapeptide phosphotransferase/UDP-N-acetylglucosamine-1-phosphate transferase/glycosyltransferase involved in cell wall biosynthesis